MTVLILTSRLDTTADMVLEHLRGRAEVVRADTAEFPQHATLDAHLADGTWHGVLATEHRTVRLGEVSAVYHRRPGPFNLPTTMSTGEREWAAAEARYGMGGVLGALRCRWVNHPTRNAAADYKPVQLAIARRCGLRTPQTLVTNDPDAVVKFHAEHGPLVYKTLSGAPRQAPGWTHFTEDTTGLDLDGVRHTAHLFQPRLAKQYEVRLTVVGQRLFAARIDAGTEAAGLDWRVDHDALTYTTMAVPPVTAARVRRLMRSLRLRFATLDFVVEPDDGWTFLEVNPNGQWGWIEHHTGMPIARAIANDLRRGVRVMLPPRPYLDDLVRTVAQVVPRRVVRAVVGGYRLEVRSKSVLFDGVLIAVQPGPVAVLRALAEHPGRALSYADIRRATPNWAAADDHAIEMAVSRLRRALPVSDLIQTVMKRGYRLPS